jgi:hypothetical protein
MDIRSVWAFLIETIFQESDDVRQIQPTKDPPHYVKLTIEGRVPETVEELYRLLEGREMRHLAVMQLER